METLNIAPATQLLRLVYRNYASLQWLLEKFTDEYAALRIEFDRSEFMAFYEAFRHREAAALQNATDHPEPALFWFKGRHSYFNICLEAGETYYAWSCYSNSMHRLRLQRYFLRGLIR